MKAVLLSLTTIILFACSKSKDTKGEDETPCTNTNSSACKMVKYITADIEYDGQNRVIKYGSRELVYKGNFEVGYYFTYTAPGEPSTPAYYKIKLNNAGDPVELTWHPVNPDQTLVLRGDSLDFRIEYDGQSRVTKITRYGFLDNQSIEVTPGQVVQLAPHYERYEYDAKGNVVKEYTGYLNSFTLTPYGELLTTSYVEHDSRINPFQPSALLSILAASNSRSNGRYFSKNNSTEITSHFKLDAALPIYKKQNTTETAAFLYNEKCFPITRNGNLLYEYTCQ